MCVSVACEVMADAGRQGFIRRRVCLPPHVVGALNATPAAGDQEAVIVSRGIWYVRPSPSISTWRTPDGSGFIRRRVSLRPLEIRKPCVAHRAQSTLCRPPTSGPGCGKRSTVNFTNPLRLRENALEARLSWRRLRAERATRCLFFFFFWPVC